MWICHMTLKDLQTYLLYGKAFQVRSVVTEKAWSPIIGRRDASATMALKYISRAAWTESILTLTK